MRKSTERGHANHGWLDTYHTFSFANYYDPEHMGFRSLRVINEDRIAAGQGFGTHPHKDMEILTWVLEGAIAHKDSTGGGSVLRPNMIQHMTAGSGITHSEFNPSDSELTHLLQIWISPEKNGLTLSYSERRFDPDQWRGRFKVMASPSGRDGSVEIKQDVELLVAELGAGEHAAHTLNEGRYAWVQVTRGSVTVNGVALAAGDGAAFDRERELSFSASETSQTLIFDVN